MSNKKFIDEDSLFQDDDFFDNEPEQPKTSFEIEKENIFNEKRPPNESFTKNEPVIKQEQIIENKEYSNITKEIDKTENTEVKIHVKPKLEIKKEKLTNPYETKNKRTKPIKSKNNLAEKVAEKKLISISQKNIRVLDILKEIKKDYPSDSEFICQAIIEKYEREKENASKDLKTLVKECLEDLVGDKFIILKSTSDIAISNNPVPNIPQQEVDNSIKNKEKKENKNLLKGIMSSWDD